MRGPVRARGMRARYGAGYPDSRVRRSRIPGARMSVPDPEVRRGGSRALYAHAAQSPDTDQGGSTVAGSGTRLVRWIVSEYASDYARICGRACRRYARYAGMRASDRPGISQRRRIRPDAAPDQFAPVTGISAGIRFGFGYAWRIPEYARMVPHASCARG